MILWGRAEIALDVLGAFLSSAGGFMRDVYVDDDLVAACALYRV